MIMHTRIEFDSIGSLPIPGEAYYGIQSLRAKNNFSISGEKLHPIFIKNLAIIKKNSSYYQLSSKQFIWYGCKCNLRGM